jgi:hypothetical protein
MSNFIARGLFHGRPIDFHKAIFVHNGWRIALAMLEDQPTHVVLFCFVGYLVFGCSSWSDPPSWPAVLPWRLPSL